MVDIKVLFPGPKVRFTLQGLRHPQLPADSEDQTQHALYIFKASFQQKRKEM